MSELVLLHYNTPMTTSLAVAACTENEHDSVIQLVRKYADDLRDFGELVLKVAEPGISRFQISDRVFEIENSRDRRGRPTEVALLNEGQSMFLLTLLRNSAVVVMFKKALVKAFLELRDRVAGAPHRGYPLTLSHRADISVSADRTFRAYLRSATMAGQRLPEALRRANALTLANTGVDMLADLQIDPDAHLTPPPPPKLEIPDPMQPLRHWAENIAIEGQDYLLKDVVRELWPSLPDARLPGVLVQAGVCLSGYGFRRRAQKVDGKVVKYIVKYPAIRS